MTKTVKVALDEATHPQLLDFAKSVLNLEVDDQSDEAALREQIKLAGSVGEIEVATPAKKAPAKKHTTKEALSLETCEKVIVNIFSTSNETQAVPLGVNGKLMYVERDKEQTIPVAYYHALNNAKRMTYEKGRTDKVDAPIKNGREVHRFPHAVVGYL